MGRLEDVEQPTPAYTRESANALLGEVRERLVRLRDAYADLAGRRASAASRASSNGGGHGGSAGEAASAAREQVAWFEARGIVVRDIEQGLIDFPAEREGREIFLCWRLGEEAVDFWHTPEAGFPGRQPL